MKRGIVLSLLFIFISVISQATIFFASNDGNDANPGTFEKPFKTLQRSCNALSAGDTLQIKGGIFNEKIRINNSGEPIKGYITIENYGTERVVIDGGNKNAGSIITLENKSYIRIKGIEFRKNASKNFPTGISISGYGTGIEIINNKIYDITSTDNGQGITFSGNDINRTLNNILIQGNEISNCKFGDGEGLLLTGNIENFRIVKNIIHNNDSTAIKCRGVNKTMFQNVQTRKGIISGNIIYNISSKEKSANTGFSGAEGIYIDGGRDIIVEKNRVYNCDEGIEASSENYNISSSNITIRNNIIYDCSVYGVSLGGIGNQDGYLDNSSFVNNTLYNNATSINLEKTKNNTIKYNIILGNDNLFEGSIGNNRMLNNMWYSSEGNTKNLSIFTNPKFVDPSKGDFRLMYSSPAINAGAADFLPAIGETDFYGNKRAIDRVDYGAIEYGATTEINEVQEFKTNSSTIIAKPVFMSIKVDGKYSTVSEWSNHLIGVKSTGNIRKVRAYNDLSDLYIVLEGENISKYSSYQILLNKDNNSFTGYHGSEQSKVMGYDFMLENNELYEYVGNGKDWNWKYLGVVDFSKGSILEVKIPLLQMNLKKGQKINIGVSGLDDSWNVKEEILSLEYKLLD